MIFNGRDGWPPLRLRRGSELSRTVMSLADAWRAISNSHHTTLPPLLR